MPIRQNFISQKAFEKALRDWFAGQALAGLLATGQDFTDEGLDGWAWHSRASYAMADAMLAARKDRGDDE